MRNNIVNTVIALGIGALSLMAQPPSVRQIGFYGPTLLTEPGTYVLTMGQAVASSTGAGIIITGNNITLDLDGFAITGAGNATGVGVRIVGARNVVVKNGSIDSALMGVVAMNSSNVRIENLRIRGLSGAPPEAGIMLVGTSNSMIVNNQILNTALGIFIRGGATFGNRIEGNTLTASATNSPLGICYNPSDTDSNGPKGDLITRNLIRGYRQSLAFGDSSEFNVAEGNTFIFRASASSNPNSSNLVRNNTEVKMN